MYKIIEILPSLAELLFLHLFKKELMKRLSFNGYQICHCSIKDDRNRTEWFHYKDTAVTGSVLRGTFTVLPERMCLTECYE